MSDDIIVIEDVQEVETMNDESTKGIESGTVKCRLSEGECRRIFDR